MSGIESPVQIALTALLTLALVGGTGYLAARYVLGDVPLVRLGVATPLPAAVMIGGVLVNLSSPLIIVGFLVSDLLSVRGAYRVEWRDAVLVTVVHYALTFSVGLVIGTLLR